MTRTLKLSKNQVKRLDALKEKYGYVKYSTILNMLLDTFENSAENLGDLRIGKINERMEGGQRVGSALYQEK